MAQWKNLAPKIFPRQHILHVVKLITISKRIYECDNVAHTCGPLKKLRALNYVHQQECFAQIQFKQDLYAHAYSNIAEVSSLMHPCHFLIDSSMHMFLNQGRKIYVYVSMPNNQYFELQAYISSKLTSPPSTASMHMFQI